MTRALELAPMVVFMAGALFAVGAMLINSSPSNPLGWQLFVGLAPVVREPAHWLVHDLSLGYSGALLVFMLAGLSCLWFATSGRDLLGPRFIVNHAALVMLLGAMGGSSVFQAGNEGVVLGDVTLLSWTPSLWLFPQSGLVLAGAVALACALLHVTVIRGIVRDHATRRDIDARMAEQLRAFA